MAKKCCFTGYRPAKLSYLKDEFGEEYQKLCAVLQRTVREAADMGYDYFISGYAEGVDLIAAEIVLGLKNEGYNLFLEAAIPALNQAERWSDRSRAIYELQLDRADRICCVEEKMTRFSALKRNDYMIHESDLVIAVFDGQKGGTAYTVDLARKKKRNLWIINPNDFTVTKEEGFFL